MVGREAVEDQTPSFLPSGLALNPQNAAATEMHRKVKRLTTAERHENVEVSGYQRSENSRLAGVPTRGSAHPLTI
jgi:hypothetical protein